MNEKQIIRIKNEVDKEKSTSLLFELQHFAIKKGVLVIKLPNKRKLY